MSFTNFMFYPLAGCLTAVLAVVQFLFRKRPEVCNRLSKIILLLFSYLVMGLYDWRFCVCITAVIIITYFSALWIARLDGKKRQWCARIAVGMLILMLGVFKYFNFFMSTVLALAGQSWHTLKIILPLGISFYIFSAVGYILDVEWGGYLQKKVF